ncbi:MAG: hypothetical protein Q4C49_05685 [Bacillota bacterium]|nr:hypothetical protein [Bacillota bacterium]
MNNKYDYVMSLGFNCEVSFRLTDYFNEISTYLYSWCGELDRDLFVESLSHMDSIFKNGVSVTEENLLNCDTFQIKFHPRHELFPAVGEYTQQQFEEAKEELDNRLSHLKEKTKKAFKSEKKKLFFIKVEDKGEQSNIEYIQKLYSTLKKNCAENSITLVCTLEKKALTKSIKDLETEDLLIRSIYCFAPIKHTDVFGDVIGWYKVINGVVQEKNNKYFSNLLKREWNTLPGKVIYRIKRTFIKG